MTSSESPLESTSEIPSPRPESAGWRGWLDKIRNRNSSNSDEVADPGRRDFLKKMAVVAGGVAVASNPLVEQGANILEKFAEREAITSEEFTQLIEMWTEDLSSEDVLLKAEKRKEAVIKPLQEFVENPLSQKAKLMAVLSLFSPVRSPSDFNVKLENNKAETTENNRAWEAPQLGKDPHDRFEFKGLSPVQALQELLDHNEVHLLDLRLTLEGNSQPFDFVTKLPKVSSAGLHELPISNPSAQSKLEYLSPLGEQLGQIVKSSNEAAAETKSKHRFHPFIGSGTLSRRASFEVKNKDAEGAKYLEVTVIYSYSEQTKTGDQSIELVEKQQVLWVDGETESEKKVKQKPIAGFLTERDLEGVHVSPLMASEFEEFEVEFKARLT